ncbi:hypothetical protein BB560_002130 [Smittium megazygosporum]|uniref:Uncharacterized protein n=1 Tax=Smittium megazygosporum TaxID=133381 RepID=A0A2T9ZFL5_9FUNG|nr:hypothetical protein BB560_002130 [Smittium megazygosporum]
MYSTYFGLRPLFKPLANFQSFGFVPSASLLAKSSTHLLYSPTLNTVSLASRFSSKSSSNKNPPSKYTIKTSKRIPEPGVTLKPESLTSQGTPKKSSRSIWLIYKSIAPKYRIFINLGLMMFAFFGLYISDFLEKRFEPTKSDPSRGSNTLQLPIGTISKLEEKSKTQS